MTIAIKKRLISSLEYRKMVELAIFSSKDRLELINGEILHMSPIGSRHQGIINKINALFAPIFLPKGVVQIQGPIQIKDYSEPQPDILLLKPRADYYGDAIATPEEALLLIEVSDSTLEFDQKTKLSIYANAGIQEYWIINLQENQIEIYRDPAEGAYVDIKNAQGSDTISCLCLPELVLTAKDILD